MEGTCVFVETDTEILTTEMDDVSSQIMTTEGYHIVSIEPAYGFRTHSFNLVITVNRTLSESNVMCVFDGGLF
jgi:hypothetical protein